MEKKIALIIGCFLCVQTIAVNAGSVCSTNNTVQPVGADFDRDDEKENGNGNTVSDPDVEAAIISVSARRAHNLSHGTKEKINKTIAQAPVAKLHMFRTAETMKFPRVDHEKLVYFRELAGEVEDRKTARSVSASAARDEQKSSRETNNHEQNNQNSLIIPGSSQVIVTDLD